VSLQTFREEARAWIEGNAPESMKGRRMGGFDGYWGGRKPVDTRPDVVAWFQMCLERGWTAPTWPTEYGGAALSKDEARALDEEMARLELPPPLVGVGLAMIGQLLIEYGTDEQKNQHLPPIVRGEIRWCQGYSEPSAGSDLASLRTAAALDDNHYVVNGQKVWTSWADVSDWMFCLVRTETDGPKWNGITFLLFDMESPGISTRPILLISGSSVFCEVFFEDLRVPASNVVHEVNAGWSVAKALLGYERSMIGEAMGGAMELAKSDPLALARRYFETPEGEIPEPEFRREIAALTIEEACFLYTLRRVSEAAQSGKAPGAESSILKIVGSELKQRRRELNAKIAGPQALGWEGPGFDDAELGITREWLRARGNTIEGGTSEIQLNIIAKRVLGLPKG
jgi:alkylation response protein AidB-like acyl-CoA dehydrogenase